MGFPVMIKQKLDINNHDGTFSFLFIPLKWNELTNLDSSLYPTEKTERFVSPPGIEQPIPKKRLPQLTRETTTYDPEVRQDTILILMKIRYITE